MSCLRVLLAAAIGRLTGVDPVTAQCHARAAIAGQGDPVRLGLHPSEAALLGARRGGRKHGECERAADKPGRSPRVTLPLEQVLADWREKANSLRVMKAHVTPDTLEQALTDIESAAERYLRWLNETDAHLYSGRSLRWLRGEYQRLEAQGDAKRVHGKRFFRMGALPAAPNADQIVGEAQRDAMEDVA